MKTAGLIGGMSWESTVPYYRIVNQAVAARLGGLHSARLIVYSVDFHEIERLQREGRWEDAGRALGEVGRTLRMAGAEFLVLCANTMHIVADPIEEAAGIPLLHIADATAAAVTAQRIRTVGLLGTRYTMEQDFYKGRLERNHGLRVLVPERSERELIHKVIYEELCRGKVLNGSRSAFREIIARLVAQGAEGVVLGCTEIGMLIEAGDSAVPLFDTAEIHALAAADFMLEGHETEHQGP